MFLRMLGQRDTQYSQFDSERRINGNARLLEGGNTLNRPFPLFVTWGRLTMGSVSGRSISELSHECSAHARTDTESAAPSAQEGPGTMRPTRPRAPTLRGSCWARRAKQASAWAQASTAVSTASRAPGLGRVVQPWPGAVGKAAVNVGGQHAALGCLCFRLTDKCFITMNCNLYPAHCMMHCCSQSTSLPKQNAG